MDLVKVKEIRTNQGSQAPGNISQWGGVLPGKQETHTSGCQGGNKDRYGDPDPFDRMGHQVDDDRHDGYPHETSAIQPILHQEVEGEKGRNNSPPDVKGDHRLRPLFNQGDYVLHAKEGDLLARVNLLCREFCDRDIHVASQQREEQQSEDIPMVDAHLHVRVFKDADLNQDNQQAEEE